MQEEDPVAKKKAAQAAAHKRWRESEKGKAYYLKKRRERLGIDVVRIEAK